MLLNLVVLIISWSCALYAGMPHTFTTERVFAERITAEHTQYLDEIFSNPQIREIWGLPEEVNTEEAIEWLPRLHNHWETFDSGLYCIFEKDTHVFMGLAGFHMDKIEEDTLYVYGFDDTINTQVDALEIYYLYMPHYWRKGYGYEVAQQLITLAFECLPYDAIIAYIRPENYPSHQLIKKLQFKQQGTILYKDELHLLYRRKK